MNATSRYAGRTGTSGGTRQGRRSRRGRDVERRAAQQHGISAVPRRTAVAVRRRRRPTRAPATRRRRVHVVAMATDRTGNFSTRDSTVEACLRAERSEQNRKKTLRLGLQKWRYVFITLLFLIRL